MRLTRLVPCVLVLSLACAQESTPDGGAPRDGGLREDTLVDGGAPIDGAPRDARDVDAGASGDCPAFGRWPAPTTTLTLTPNDEGGIYLPDIQASRPEVDWATLDRLYIQAGTYAYIHIGNLPMRTAEHPLVITNLGGQVRVGPAPSEGFGYLWIMNGGANWVLTGRYDPDAQVGDVGFQGHRCGAYANSQDTYGFLSDDELIGFPDSMNHMGIVVNGARAFELEYLEIRRSTFAGVRIFIADGVAGGAQPPPTDDVHIHDLYVHDTGGEGLYFGSTSSGVPHGRFRRLRLHDLRVLRTANEVAQIQSAGEGSEVSHNVFAYGALNWRNAFEQDQDNASQFALRDGPFEVHHNVFLGGRESLGNLFAATETGDVGGTIAFHDNYFGDTVWLGIYFGIRGVLPDVVTRYEFVDNLFVDLDPTLDVGYFTAPYYTSRPASNELFRIGGSAESPVRIAGNRWTGPRIVAFRPASFVTLEDDVGDSEIDRLEFVDPIVPDGTPGIALEMWVSTTAPWAGSMPVTYPVGALVMDGLHMYRCTTASLPGGARPSADGGAHWQDLGVPSDDVRLAPSSPHQDMGLDAHP